MKGTSQADDIKKFLLGHIPEHPSDIVALTMARFHISRPAVHKHLTALIRQGQVKKEGSTRNAAYRVLHSGLKTWKIAVNPNLQEDEVWEKYIAPEAQDLPINVHRICLYGFTEMMNNIVDHSEASKAIIEFGVEANKVKLSLKDNGIGIFKKIQMALSLPDIRESILHLSKGKLTTDPTRHTGEGIFFTSRAFDEFSIQSGELEYICFSKDHDWLIQSCESRPVVGTSVSMTIDRTSTQELDRIFKKFSDSEYSFNKTNVFVKMAKLKGEKYISRSQAKRLLFGLDKFKKIVLDFQEVPTVGQAFVDEVFRVFKNSHPEIEIEYVNTNPNVEFMIQRGLPTE